MENNKSKKIAQIAAGIFGGTILGLIGFTKFIGVGGSACDESGSACDCFCCHMFGMRGYESCGLLGAIVGIAVGCAVGVFILSRFKSEHFLRMAVYLVLGAFLLPLITGFLLEKNAFEGDNFFVILVATSFFVVISALLSVVITGIISLAKFLNDKKSRILVFKNNAGKQQ